VSAALSLRGRWSYPIGASGLDRNSGAAGGIFDACLGRSIGLAVLDRDSFRHAASSGPLGTMVDLVCSPEGCPDRFAVSRSRLVEAFVIVSITVRYMATDTLIASRFWTTGPPLTPEVGPAGGSDLPDALPEAAVPANDDLKEKS
jgi:hypothetical protein